MEDRVDKLKELIALNNELHSIQDLDVLLEKILTNVKKFVNADAGTIYLRKGNKLVFSYAQNDTKQKELPPGKKLIYFVFSVEINEKSVSGYVAEKKEILNIPDVYNIPKDAPYSFNPSYDIESKYKTTSSLTIPLLTNLGEVSGVIQVLNAKDSDGNVIPFSIEDELYVSYFANTASMALQQAQLTRQIILRMISMAELRDPKETGPHVNRVAGYAVEIYEHWAQKRGMPVNEIEKNRDLLRMAAMLHDVGKVAISDAILKKPGKFTPEEYEIMKEHTYKGSVLFKDKQSEFDEMASIVALTHHENWDGTGYPGKMNTLTDEPIKDENGKPVLLKGEEIPIFGRVVALADVFDALCCRRVYKEAWAESEVLLEIRKMAGTKFDPELVESFFEIIDQIKMIHQLYPDDHTA